MGLGGLNSGPKKPGGKTTDAQKKKKTTEDGDEDEDDPIVKAEKEFYAIIKKVDLSCAELCNARRRRGGRRRRRGQWRGAPTSRRWREGRSREEQLLKNQ